MAVGGFQYTNLESSDGKKGSTALPPRVPRKSNWPNRVYGSGWRGLVGVGCTLAATVLVINVIILAWGLSRPSESSDSTKVLFKGDCSKSSRIFVASHLFINILSTLLLGASNAGIQILVAPTREEVQAAHDQRTWLHIGVFGFRNLKWIKQGRVWLCFFLAISSVPLHLFYNSTLFHEIAVYDYRAFVVTDDFVQGRDWDTHYISSRFSYLTNDSSSTDLDEQSIKIIDDDIQALQDLAVAGELEYMSTSDCLKTFGQVLVSSYRRVLMVTPTISDMKNDSIYGMHSPVFLDYRADETGVPSTRWACAMGPADCVSRNATAEGSWLLAADVMSPSMRNGHSTFPVQYCLAQKALPQCKMRLNWSLLTVVVISNCIKIICLGIAYSMRSHKPLVTVGDAICTFVTESDPSTDCGGALSCKEVRDGKWYVRLKAVEIAQQRIPSSVLHLPGTVWTGKTYLSFSAAPARRWTVTTALSVTVWAACVGLIPYTSAPDSDGFRFTFGFNLSNVFPLKATLLGAVLIVNLPQLVVSILYLLINSLFTCMLLSREYADFSTKPKPLRVSDPLGTQRSTYWLQLPKRFAIPILGSMAVLHWLISESIYVVYLTHQPILPGQSAFTGIGISPGATVLACVLGGLIVLSLGAMGIFKLPSTFPVASSCSAAISAACHAPASRDIDVVYRQLQCGALHGTSEKGQQALGFSSTDRVGPLITGNSYGGQSIQPSNAVQTTIEYQGCDTDTDFDMQRRPDSLARQGLNTSLGHVQQHKAVDKFVLLWERTGIWKHVALRVWLLISTIIIIKKWTIYNRFYLPLIPVIVSAAYTLGATIYLSIRCRVVSVYLDFTVNLILVLAMVAPIFYSTGPLVVLSSYGDGVIDNSPYMTIEVFLFMMCAVNIAIMIIASTSRSRQRKNRCAREVRELVDELVSDAIAREQEDQQRHISLSPGMKIAKRKSDINKPLPSTPSVSVDRSTETDRDDIAEMSLLRTHEPSNFI